MKTSINFISSGNFLNLSKMQLRNIEKKHKLTKFKSMSKPKTTELNLLNKFLLNNTNISFNNINKNISELDLKEEIQKKDIIINSLKQHIKFLEHKISLMQKDSNNIKTISNNNNNNINDKINDININYNNNLTSSNKILKPISKSPKDFLFKSSKLLKYKETLNFNAKTPDIRLIKMKINKSKDSLSNYFTLPQNKKKLLTLNNSGNITIEENSTNISNNINNSLLYKNNVNLNKTRNKNNLISNCSSKVIRSHNLKFENDEDNNLNKFKNFSYNNNISTVKIPKIPKKIIIKSDNNLNVASNNNNNNLNSNSTELLKINSNIKNKYNEQLNNIKLRTENLIKNLLNQMNIK
jgi:hypothetical protein